MEPAHGEAPRERGERGSEANCSGKGWSGEVRKKTTKIRLGFKGNEHHARKGSSSGQVTAALLKLPSHASICTGMTQKSAANGAGCNICSNAGQISR